MIVNLRRVILKTHLPSCLNLDFLGFSSKRFGRTLDLAETFVQHRILIQKFYDEQVFLACYAYIHSSWFNLCCELGAKLNKIAVIPLKAAIGIDDLKSSKSESRSWSVLRNTFTALTVFNLKLQR